MDTPDHPWPVEQVTVPLDGRAYDILIGCGLLERSGELLARQIRDRQVHIVTDENVAARYLERLVKGLGPVGQGIADPVVLPAGEETKSFEGLEKVLLALIDGGIERADLVIALGGGVIGDLAGLASSLVLRGVGYIQVPTTLLAQVDSSVGGKTAIDVPQGKNLVGSFHQPRAVLADLNTLAGLDRRQMRAGYAEIVKTALIDRPDFFTWLEDNGHLILSGDIDAQGLAVRTSCEAKAEIVAADEREAGRRALLNLGHSFAHAMEMVGGYDGRILHGEAVAIGLVLAARLSEQLGMAREAVSERIMRHLTDLGFDPGPPDWLRAEGTDALMAAMARDKKNRGGRHRLVLLQAIGQALVVEDVDKAGIETVWNEYLGAPGRASQI